MSCPLSLICIPYPILNLYPLFHFFSLSRIPYQISHSLCLLYHTTGMSSLVYTILQHVMEEPGPLAQAMETTLKLCWMRLSRQRAVKVID